MLTEDDVKKVVAQIRSAMKPVTPDESPSRDQQASDGKHPVPAPRDGRPLSDLADDLGKVSRQIYSRFGAPVVLDPITKRLVELSPDCFRTFVSRFARIIKTDFKQDPPREVEVSLSREHCRAVLVSQNFNAQLPPIRGLVTVAMPYRGQDDRIRLLRASEIESYDPEAQLLMLPSFALDEMTLEESKTVLDELLQEFPFEDPEHDKAVQVAAMLSMFCLGLLSGKAQVPVFIYSANSQRSGKSLLAKVAIIPALGSAAVRTLSGDDEEIRKALDAAVLDGSRYLFLDNLKRKISSSALEAFTTGAAWAGRKLGMGTGFEADKQMVLFITANDAKVSTDMSGRALFVQLWIPEGDPQSRRFGRVIDDGYLSRDDVRQRILSALWGLVRHWDAAGRPRPEKPLLGFEEWSRVIGGIVSAAGYGDPLKRPEMAGVGDDDTADIVSLLRQAIAHEIPRDGFKFADLVAIAAQGGLFGVTETDHDRLDNKENSRLGRLFASRSRTPERAKVPGRQYVVDGKTVYFSHRGKGDSRRYVVEVA